MNKAGSFQMLSSLVLGLLGAFPVQAQQADLKAHTVERVAASDPRWHLDPESKAVGNESEPA